MVKRLVEADMNGNKIVNVADPMNDQDVATKKYTDSRQAPLVTNLIENAYTDGVMYIAHRGGANMYPENTIEAFRASLSAGIKAFETDCYVIQDGAVGIMHDTTVTRTTTFAGYCISQTSSSWKALQVDIGATLGGQWATRTQSAPLLDEVVKEFGNKDLMILEGKNTGSGAAIVNSLLRYNVAKDAVIVTSFDMAELVDATSVGYPTMLAVSDTSADPADLTAAGIEYISCPTTTTEAFIASMVDAGIKVFIYTVDYHYQRDIFIGYGATGFFSNDPVYLQQKAIATEDGYGSQNWLHGMNLATGVNRGAFYSTDFWGYSSSAADGDRWQVLQGWACPIKNDKNCNSFTIDFVVNFAAIPTSRWCSIWVCSNTDLPYTDVNDTTGNGYHCLFRNTGVMDIYKVTNGTAVLASTTTTGTAITTGVNYSLRVTVTPTTVKWERLGTGAISTTLTDSAFRGGYFQFGCRGLAAPKFANVAIS